MFCITCFKEGAHVELLLSLWVSIRMIWSAVARHSFGFGAHIREQFIFHGRGHLLKEGPSLGSGRDEHKNITTFP